MQGEGSKLASRADAPRTRRVPACRPAFAPDADVSESARERASRLSRLAPELVRIVAAFVPSTAARKDALRDAGNAGAIAALYYAGAWWPADRPHEIVQDLWLSGRWHDKGVFARSSSLAKHELEVEIARAVREEEETMMAFVRAFRAEDDRRARARAPPPG